MACEIIRIEDDLIFARVTGVMGLADQAGCQTLR